MKDDLIETLKNELFAALDSAAVYELSAQDLKIYLLLSEELNNE